MEEKISSVQVVILWLSFTSATTGNLYHQVHSRSAGNNPAIKEIPNEILYATPLTPLATAKRVEEIGNETPGFQDVVEGTQINLYDGNRPEDGTLLTHDHVDRIIGLVSPTKRVKKILPPFDTTKEKSLNKRETLKNKTEEEMIERNFIENGIKDVPKENLKSANTTLEREQENRIKHNKISGNMSSEKAETIFKGDNSKVFSLEREKNPSTPFPDSNLLIRTENEIQGILLVPSEHDVFPVTEKKDEREGENDENEEEKYEPTMEKSIWDLLKEREDLREPDILDESSLDLAKNESETTTPEVTTTSKKTPFDQFDADSAEIESKMRRIKMEKSNAKPAISYALPWLGSKTLFEPEEKNKNNNESDAWVENMKEIEKLLELTRDENFSDLGSNSVIVSGETTGNEGAQNERPGKWFLFLLAGNLTIIQLRIHDFSKYLKVNLAARLSVEYDDVKVNKLVLVPPKILVNVTVFGPQDRSGDKRERSLVKMTETNATLLELSGEEYHLIRFFSADSLRKPEAHKRIKSSGKSGGLPGDVQFIFYTFLGSCCACALILLFLVSVNKYFRKVTDMDWPWLDLGSPAWRQDRANPMNVDELSRPSPSVIFSRRFSEGRSTSEQVPPTPWTELESSLEPPWWTPSSASIPADLDDDVPTATKLQMFNCDVDRLLFSTSLERKTESSDKSDANPSQRNLKIDIANPPSPSPTRDTKFSYNNQILHD